MPGLRKNAASIPAWVWARKIGSNGRAYYAYADFVLGACLVWPARDRPRSGPIWAGDHGLFMLPMSNDPSTVRASSSTQPPADPALSGSFSRT